MRKPVVAQESLSTARQPRLENALKAVPTAAARNASVSACAATLALIFPAVATAPKKSLSCQCPSGGSAGNGASGRG